jgi:putative phosphoserine phosphatase / 1-acylglycerol-3-phosphate O-acyltransferase
MALLHPPPSPGIDFFDVDHTVVDGSTSLNFLLTGVKLGIFSIKILTSIPVFLWQYRFGSMDLEKVQKSILGFEGFRQEELAKLSVINFEKNIRKKIFRECELLIHKLSIDGRKIGFVTSSFTHVIQPLVDYLKIDYVVTNSLKYIGGVTNGEFQEPFIFGKEKKNQSLALLEQLGVSPLDCSFYTDSINDLSLLEQVGKPVAVNPDWRLKKIAKQKNWEILNFRQ